ncbi:MAG: hypothetical protein PVG07_10985, partial [Acidobacteriota bacterium]
MPDFPLDRDPELRERLPDELLVRLGDDREETDDPRLRLLEREEADELPFERSRLAELRVLGGGEL